MIVGVGIDIVKVEKMRLTLECWGEAFINRVFNPSEIANLTGKIYYQRLAARFAAKEAIVKAISEYYPLALRDIFILNRANGSPFCRFKKDINFNFLISLTHIKDYAVACAVAQEKA